MNQEDLSNNFIKKPLEPKNQRLPHDDVYTRLGCSTIHGIGVFAIKDIPEGMNIFGDDNEAPFIVDKETVAKQDEEIRKLYFDFCAVEGGKYCCPDNFNNLTVSWYLNESKTPNTRSNGYEFYAKREIKKGEELTVDYDTFSEKAE